MKEAYIGFIKSISDYFVENEIKFNDSRYSEINPEWRILKKMRKKFERLSKITDSFDNEFTPEEYKAFKSKVRHYFAELDLPMTEERYKKTRACQSLYELQDELILLCNQFLNT